ncbi:MAG: SGNH/GDSL hydrolase family protein [Flavitalea sp.]
MKVLILTDSLSLPRNKPEQVGYYETWPRLLEKEIPGEYVSIGIGGGTSTDIFNQSTYYESIHPDLVIVQSGIVDCAPRGFSKFELSLIRKTAFSRYLMFKVVGVDKMRTMRKVTYTPIGNYQANIKKLCKQFSYAKVFWLGIAPVKDVYEKQLQGVTENVKKYNQVLKDMSAGSGFTYIPMDEFPLDGFMSDHHHFNQTGHKWVSEKIKAVLQATAVEV